jgi:hypothetical protein
VSEVLMLPWLIPPFGIFIATFLHFLLSCVFISPCGGGLEYLHRSPASRIRRRKGNPVPGDTTGPPCH